MSLLKALVDSVCDRGLLDEACAILKVTPPAGDADADPALQSRIFGLVADAAILSAGFREKMFKPGYPENLGLIGYMSDRDLRYAVTSGFSNAAKVFEYIEKYCQLPDGASILDFGCGTLRVSRYLIQFKPQYRYLACEVNPHSLEWVMTRFGDAARIFPMNERPPLELADGSVDFAFAWSIFSHYSERLHRDWLEELHRILRPGGYLLATIHGGTLLDRVRNEEGMLSQLRGDGVDMGRVGQDYASPGYGYYSCYPEGVESVKWNPKDFGMSFISPGYIEREWSKLFEVVTIDPGVISNFQDVVLLRRPA